MGLIFPPKCYRRQRGKPGLTGASDTRRHERAASQRWGRRYSGMFAGVGICSVGRNLFRRTGASHRRSVIVSDLHERAIQAGWQRCFEVEGARYQIEHFEHTARELDEAAKGVRLPDRLARRIAYRRTGAGDLRSLPEENMHSRRRVAFRRFSPPAGPGHDTGAVRQTHRRKSHPERSQCGTYGPGDPARPHRAIRRIIYPRRGD